MLYLDSNIFIYAALNMDEIGEKAEAIISTDPHFDKIKKTQRKPL